MFVSPELQTQDSKTNGYDQTKGSGGLSQNVTELRLDVYINNIAAIKAYEKAGFTSHMIEMRMSLKAI